MRKGPWYRNLAGVIPALFSCRRYTKLASHSLDEELSRSESFFMRFHHIICTVCRRYRRQINLIEAAGRSLERRFPTEGSEQKRKLSDTFKDQMNEAVKRELSAK
ncbi:hypothetical protein OAO01_01110 [Oligoflexia bacterium]|nr:hypothetical protein [Oligoflexia bacterium]